MRYGRVTVNSASGDKWEEDVESYFKEIIPEYVLRD
jgi:hypothetical protein